MGPKKPRYLRSLKIIFANEHGVASVFAAGFSALTGWIIDRIRAEGRTCRTTACRSIAARNRDYRISTVAAKM
jgi:hypothetical protein